MKDTNRDPTKHWILAYLVEVSRIMAQVTGTIPAAGRSEKGT